MFWKNGRNELYRCIYPNRILSVSNNGRTMSPELVLKVGVFLGLYILVIVVGSVLLSLTGVSAADSFITSFTCVSNVGDCVPSVGVSPVESYMLIPSAGKWILSMLMLTGRLEIFTILVLLTRAFWRK
ncbi:MAG: potassium transporter TrkG [Muribaculaceae bacterium]|nr:potassium transporter TrkG [Muribaculaceae bacterium]